MVGETPTKTSIFLCGWGGGSADKGELWGSVELNWASRSVEGKVPFDSEHPAGHRFGWATVGAMANTVSEISKRNSKATIERAEIPMQWVKLRRAPRHSKERRGHKSKAKKS